MRSIKSLQHLRRVYSKMKRSSLWLRKPFSPLGCMEGGIDEVTVVEQKLSTPPGSMLVEGKKEAVVNQRPSALPGSILG
ncbi:hypothetical protein CQW23_04571 [Capsicum baccatum]|uniref:Uncharacterized protein n=1 Tax=Capsicum baccatum TaxID=33114 RepID=A0A2G2XF05_CAPBA|nr:hypothetical protein CQW23_04571 [Capsicum baccatum]